MTQEVNLEQYSTEQLLALKTKIDALIQNNAAAEIAILETKIATLRPLLNGSDMSIAIKPKQATKTSTKRVKAKAKVTKSAGGNKRQGKAPIKFKDPESGKTWSGRGMTPIWLRDHEAAGKKREVFAVH